MPSYLNEKPTKTQRKKRQAKATEPKQASSEAVQEEHKTLPKCIEESQDVWFREREARTYSEMVAIDSGAIIDGILDSIIYDVQKIESLTNRDDIYALNSLVSTKLRVHKAVSERAKYFNDMVEHYANDGIESMQRRIESLERELERVKEENK